MNFKFKTIIILLAILNSCTTTTNLPPTLTTNAISEITSTSALTGGVIGSDGGTAITEQGVCWSTTTNPTINNHKVTAAIGSTSFSTTISGLTANTTYFVKAYATNSAGTMYGNEVTFTTSTGSVNTLGKLTVSTTTSSAGGSYSPDNVVAIWVKSGTGTFVKSLLVYANSRKSYLTNWVSNTAKNVTDATTGATQPNHATRTCSWNATNASGTAVANGNYILCMEISDGVRKYAEFPFTIGSNPFTLTPASVPSFSNISLKWVPN